MFVENVGTVYSVNAFSFNQSVSIANLIFGVLILFEHGFKGNALRIQCLKVFYITFYYGLGFTISIEYHCFGYYDITVDKYILRSSVQDKKYQDCSSYNSNFDWYWWHGVNVVMSHIIVYDKNNCMSFS